MRLISILAAASLIALALPPQMPLGWQRANVSDQLHQSKYVILALRGETVAGSLSEPPVLSAFCQEGKLWSAYLSADMIFQASGLVKSLLGEPQSMVEKRLDGKFTSTFWTITNTQFGKSLSIGTVDFGKIIHGKVFIVGMTDATTGLQTQVKFEMPDPSPVMEACGKTKGIRAVK